MRLLHPTPSSKWYAILVISAGLCLLFSANIIRHYYQIYTQAGSDNTLVHIPIVESANTDMSIDDTPISAMHMLDEQPIVPEAIISALSTQREAENATSKNSVIDSDSAAKINEALPPQPTTYIVEHLGADAAAIEAAIMLPSAVALAFDLNTDAISHWITKAQMRGHTTLLHIPQTTPGDNATSSYQIPLHSMIKLSMPLPRYESENRMQLLNYILRHHVEYTLPVHPQGNIEGAIASTIYNTLPVPLPDGFTPEILPGVVAFYEDSNSIWDVPSHTSDITYISGNLQTIARYRQFIEDNPQTLRSLSSLFDQQMNALIDAQ